MATPGTREVRPTRVVFVNRFFYPDESATSRILSDLAFRLAARGLAVAIVTSRQLYEKPGARLPSHEHIHGVDTWRIATTSFGRRGLFGRALDYATFHLSAAVALLRLLKPGDVVVAKTDPPLISVVVSWVARWRGVSVVNWLQDLFPEVATALTPAAIPTWLQATLAGIRDRSLRAAAVNVVIGGRMAARVTARGVDPGRIRIIPNWADCDAIRPMDPNRSATRARLGLLDRFVTGYSGNFGRAHEFDTLIDAARLLIDEPQLAFLMTGGGAKFAPLRDAIERAGLSSFHFQGYQSPELLSDSMAAANVHLVSLLPAAEGLIVPSKIYSILAAGRPMVFVGDPDGEISRIVRQQQCGLAVAIGDAQGLADALRALCADRAHCAAMAANARRLALACHTGEGAATDWFETLTRARAHRA